MCKQDPGADSALEKGGKVNIVISKGVEKGSIPDLSGMTAEQAEKAIKDAGYTPQYAGNEASEADADTVSKQDPQQAKRLTRAPRSNTGSPPAPKISRFPTSWATTRQAPRALLRRQASQ